MPPLGKNPDLRVPLTATMRQRASETAARLLPHLVNRRNVQERERWNSAYYGALGELAFEALLRRRGVPARPLFGGGAADPHDFAIAANGARVDVKVAKVSTRSPVDGDWCFGFPTEQAPEEKDVLVVGTITDTEACFYGSFPGRGLRGRPATMENTYLRRLKERLNRPDIRSAYDTENVEIRWLELDPAFPRIPGLV